MSAIALNVPLKYTKGDWRRLGDRIRSNPDAVSESDIKMLQDLRLTYKEPLARIFNVLEKSAHKIDKDCICTYRVKRIDSIISKMRRLPEMVISRADDIAGCRCIVHKEEQVYALFDKLGKLAEKGHLELRTGGHDYIKDPKPGGYKSLHVIVSIPNDNRRIEIQIRTVEHHNWATLVEISDLLFNSKIKEYNNEKCPDLYEFHLLLSKSSGDLHKEDKYRIYEIAQKYKYIERLSTVFQKNYIDVRREWNRSGIQRKHFFLISADSTASPEFEGFSVFEEAEAAYFEKYLNNKSNKNIVLTHLEHTRFEKISMAYSNYMLTYNAMIIRLLTILSEVAIDNYSTFSLSRFKETYRYFLDMIYLWAANQAMDIDSLNRDKRAKQSVLLKEDWVNSITTNVNILNRILGYTQHNLRYQFPRLIPYLSMKSLFREFTDKIGR